MNTYLVQYKLRTDTNSYDDTDLTEWKEVIEKAIEYYNEYGSMFKNERHLELIEINEKDIFFNFITNEYVSRLLLPKKISPFSRYLKKHGMRELSSPHGKLFTVEIINSQIDPETKKPKKKKNKLNLNKKVKKSLLNSEEIHVDHSSKCIYIPKAWMEIYCIRFFDTPIKSEDDDN